MGEPNVGESNFSSPKYKNDSHSYREQCASFGKGHWLPTACYGLGNQKNPERKGTNSAQGNHSAQVSRELLNARNISRHGPKSRVPAGDTEIQRRVPRWPWRRRLPWHPRRAGRQLPPGHIPPCREPARRRARRSAACPAAPRGSAAARPRSAPGPPAAPRAQPWLTWGPRASGSRRGGAFVPMAAAGPRRFAGPALPLPSQETPAAGAGAGTALQAPPSACRRQRCARRWKAPEGRGMRGCAETAPCSGVVPAPEASALRVLRPCGIPAGQRGKRGPTPGIPRCRLLALPCASEHSAVRKCRQLYCYQASLWILPANIHDT